MSRDVGAEPGAPPRVEVGRDGLAGETVGLARQQEPHAIHRHLHGHAPLAHDARVRSKCSTPARSGPASSVALWISVATIPGATALTAIPRRAQLVGQALGQPDHRGLGRSICAVARKRAESAAPREGDDPGPAPPLEQREPVLGERVEPEHVGAKRPPPGRALGLLEGADGPEGARRDDQAVERRRGSPTPRRRARAPAPRPRHRRPASGRACRGRSRPGAPPPGARTRRPRARRAASARTSAAPMPALAPAIRIRRRSSAGAVTPAHRWRRGSALRPGRARVQHPRRVHHHGPTEGRAQQRRDRPRRTRPSRSGSPGRPRPGRRRARRPPARRREWKPSPADHTRPGAPGRADRPPAEG